MNDEPNFASWQHELLAQFARDSYRRIKQLEEANEQLRLDLKDAMKLTRQQIIKGEPKT